MSEVYLAEDTKLDRQVAFKILPQEFAADKDRMSRIVCAAKICFGFESSEHHHHHSGDLARPTHYQAIAMLNIPLN